jgi:hypothetical protein
VSMHQNRGCIDASLKGPVENGVVFDCGLIVKLDLPSGLP